MTFDTSIVGKGTLVVAVPEPSMIALLIGRAGFLVLVRRRRKVA